MTKQAYHRLEIENSGNMLIIIYMVEVKVEVEVADAVANLKKHSKNSAELADNDSNTVKYFSPTNCDGLLKKMCAAIYLSLDELWFIPNEVELKAFMLDPQLKLLLFATANKQKNTEEQIREELSILKAQFSQNNTIIEISTIKKEECDSLSAEL
ncbi:15131_t:CDS:1 [Dentiscutata erythropus]|uniref:15131_t:CDS:1 n=1 Tax=Dentiscutata erythropus TaxID=1348616 RepID=A0A9N9HPJ6_9GLOM|nr:15131_t:CDS:1 [Dentiscutata erythropus]